MDAVCQDPPEVLDPEVHFKVDTTELMTNRSRKPRPSPLDRRSGIPLYHQIQQRLLDQIQSGELRVGEPLPSIQQIATRMGVSQMTVRQAVGALCERGVIYSRQGKGTFISGIKLERDFRQVLSFSEETQARGATPILKVLSFRIQSPTQEVKEALGLSDGDRVFNLHRVRCGNSIPMGIESSCLPVQLCPGLMETFDATTSLYEELAHQYGIQLMVTDEVVEVGKASAEDPRLLQICSAEPDLPVYARLVSRKRHAGGACEVCLSRGQIQDRESAHALEARTDGSAACSLHQAGDRCYQLSV